MLTFFTLGSNRLNRERCYLVILLGVFILGSLPVQGQKRRGSKLPQGVSKVADLDYAGNDHPRQKLDLYLPRNPKSEAPLPVICWIHGGGWRNGNKAGCGRVLGYPATGSYAAVSIGYRLSDESQWPGQIHDCKAAIRYLKAHAGKYNLDPNRIGVWGSSAGGHLVAMLGVANGVEHLEGSIGPHTDQNSEVACVVDYFGPTELLAMNRQGSRMDHDAPDSPEGLLIGGPIQSNQDKARDASPIFHVSKDDEPILIVHGTKDELVPHGQSVEFEKKLEEEGVSATLVSITGGGHGSGFPFQVVDIVRQFLDFHLLKKGDAPRDQMISSPRKAPNIVHIISDDMGYSDLGCYGGEIETPVLDALAGHGLRFTNFYVNNMCWPTRASLMTGLYPKTALPKRGSAEGGLHPGARTLPEVLRTAGYATFMSGKWHLSSAGEPDGDHAPHHRGFDQFYGTIYGASDFFAPVDLQLNGQDRTHEWQDDPDYYYTDAITDYGLRFLKEKNPGGKPFYLYLSYTAAHWPLHARPSDIEQYRGRYTGGWDALRLQRHRRMKELGVIDPDWKLSPRHGEVPAWENAEHKEWQQRRMEVYAAQVTRMDRNIGRIVEHLRTSGQLDNTLILFHHDNGGCHVEYGEKRTGSWTRDFTTDGKKIPVRPGNIPGLIPGPQSTFQSYGYGWANASNTPFRLFKQFDHEGGTRSPLIVSWPRGVSHQKAGRLVHEVCHAIDLMPTLLEAAGTEMPEQRPIKGEGQSLLGSVTGKGNRIGPRTLFWNYSRGKAVRKGDWKLVGIKNGDWELYNLVNDGTELHDLSSTMPEKVKELAAEFEAWSKRTDPGETKKKKAVAQNLTQ